MKTLSGALPALLCLRGVTPSRPNAHRGFPTRIRPVIWLSCALIVLALSGDNASASRLVNLSTRARVLTGNNVMIAGIILQGSGSADLVFRGIGPSLAPHFPGQALADPYLELRNANGGLIFSNNNWQDSQAGEISGSGLAPSHGAEAAIRWSLSPGSYTAILQGVGGGTGIGLVEVYHLNAHGSIWLGNMSTRARTESSSNETLGMYVQGNGYKGLVLRALGPSTGLSGYLPNPSLRMYNSGGGLIQYNENWKDSQYLHIWASGFAPVYDNEAAMTTNPNLLSNTSYTVTVSDNSGASGITNLEIYDLGYEAYEDAVGGGTYAGYGSSSHPNDPNFQVKITPTLTPQAAGPITVHFVGNAHGTNCGPISGCPPSAQLYPQLLDQNGNLVATGSGIGLQQANTQVRGSATFNWTGAPFRVRMMARSSRSFPNADYVVVNYYDVYTP